MKNIIIPVFMLVFVEGCAVMNTFQTPKAKEPGKISLGFSGGYDLLDRDNRDFDYPLVPFDAYVRVGIVRRVDAGLRTAGFTSIGADVKFQFLKRPFPASINAGFGRGANTNTVFGFSEEEYNTKFAGIVAGYDDFYVGFKVTDYFYQDRSESDGDDNAVFIDEVDRIIPAFTLGFTAPDVQTVSPMFELNSYFVPQPIVTASFGLKFNF
jgi:hypothetical protein